jgi:hydroxymethylpyrimidine pyrophosphatase-like HAD family hydrolase
MKVSALALDYDGTIAVEGVLHPAVREAIAEARRRGIVVLLVTGRQLAELHHVAGDLTCFDVVVGENGAVLEFPSSGRHVAIGHAPSPTFLQELRGRGVPFTVGESVIEADADQAESILQVIRSTEQPLILAFNRSRVMVLPQAVSKSTGLRRALTALRVSIHNTVGIGDAENDHDLLDACEVGVAVQWGSAGLRSVADEIIAGTGPAAVADYIQRVSREPWLTAAQMGRRSLLLGHQHDGAPVKLEVRGRAILIAGEPGTGKSWLAALLCEQLILQSYCLCIIDPEGDYRALEALPGIIPLGGDDPPPPARELERVLRYPDVSIILDLSRIGYREKLEYLRALLPLLITLRRGTGRPHKILLDEAHYFLMEPDGERLVGPELAGYILVTSRISSLPRTVQTADDLVVMVTRETDPDEGMALLSMCRPQPTERMSTGLFRDLRTSEAVLLPGAAEAHGHVRRFLLAPRLTSHVRNRAKCLDITVPDAKAFVFTENGRPGPRARTLKEFTSLLATLPSDRLAGHLHRHDFSRWIEDVIRDHPLAAHIRKAESRVESDDARDVAQAIARAIFARHEPAAAP